MPTLRVGGVGLCSFVIFLFMLSAVRLPTTGRNGAGRSAIRCGAKTASSTTLPAVDPTDRHVAADVDGEDWFRLRWPAVADGRVFVTDRIADENLERVLCFDAETGKEIWKHEYEARYTISYPLGPRATPTVDGDRVYTLGADGALVLFRRATGNIMWQKNLPTDFGTKVPAWGMAGAPLVDGDQLIVLAGGKPDAMVVSLDKHTGKERGGHSMARSPATAPR